MNNEYGTVDYYTEMFSDILADVATGNWENDERTITNMLEGFERSIINWMDYYDESLSKFRDLHGRYIRGDFQKDKSA